MNTRTEQRTNRRRFDRRASRDTRPACRALRVTRRELFRSTTFRPRNTPRAPLTSRVASRKHARDAAIRLRDARARLTFSRASVARSRRVRARCVSRDASFSDQRRFARATPRAHRSRRASRAENTRATPRTVSGMRDARLTFSRASVARSRRVRARAVTRRELFRSTRFAARETPRAASRVASRKRRATPRPSAKRDAIDVFARVRRAVRRVRARSVHDASFSDQRVSPRERSREVARRSASSDAARALVRAHPYIVLNPVRELPWRKSRAVVRFLKACAFEGGPRRDARRP